MQHGNATVTIELYLIVEKKSWESALQSFACTFACTHFSLSLTDNVLMSLQFP